MPCSAHPRHVWRRIVVPGDWTLHQLHHTIRALFGWSEAHRHRFLIRGKAFPGDACETARPIPLSDFQFYPRERFSYDYRFESETPLWRHEVRVEKVLPVQAECGYPRCVGGAGTPPPEPIGTPEEFRHMMKLFTPGYIAISYIGWPTWWIAETWTSALLKRFAICAPG